MFFALLVFGACFGSFAGATIWRLRARQLAYDKKHGEEVDPVEFKHLKSLANSFGADDRSHCLHCGHMLAWYDLLPIVSWLSVGGKCRYCKKPIGWFELIIELMTAILFAVSYIFWPFSLDGWLEWLRFGIWLAILIGLIIIFWYDAKWFLVLSVTIWPLIVLAGVFVVISYVLEPTQFNILSLLGSIGILAGLYWSLWIFSKGQWVGLGDAQIGVILGLVLLDWQKAFLALLLANAIGTAIVIPGLLTKKVTRKTAVPFGPLLITGALISMLFGTSILGWFSSDFSLFLAKLLYP